PRSSGEAARRAGRRADRSCRRGDLRSPRAACGRARRLRGAGREDRHAAGARARSRSPAIVSEAMSLGRRIAARLGPATLERVGGAGVANAELNAPRIRHSLLELEGIALGAGQAAFVIGAGPSLQRRRSLERLAATGFAGAIVSVDSALGACLRHGIVPDLV